MNVSLADDWGKGWGPFEADLFMLSGRGSCGEGLDIGLSKKIVEEMKGAKFQPDHM